MPFLVWDSPAGQVVHELSRAVSVLGRDAPCDVRLEHVSVGRRHAVVQVRDAEVLITDLGSSNGTRINGARLTRDLPSTLEPGDFVHLGALLLTFHKTPPPARRAAPPPKTPAAPPPPRRRAPPPAAPTTAREVPWKWIAMGVSFVLAIVVGAVVAMSVSGSDAPVVIVSRPPPPVAETPADPSPAPPPAEEPAPRAVLPQAPVGALPPAQRAAVDRCPLLLELDDGSFRPMRLLAYAAQHLEVLDEAGMSYLVPRARVRRVLSRADLVRRAAQDRAALAPRDVAGRFELAQYLARRHTTSPARSMLREVLVLQPDHAGARSLLATLGER